MRWSDLTHNTLDENQRAIRGFWLITQGINLENLPTIFNEPFKLFEKAQSFNIKERKVYLNDIVGTSYKDYGNMEIIKSYMKIKRADTYIIESCVTKRKYDKILRKPVSNQHQSRPIELSENEDGTFYVDGNGNHRVIFYKMMMLSEIALNYQLAFEKNFNFKRELFKDIKKKYWLNAHVKSIAIK